MFGVQMGIWCRLLMAGDRKSLSMKKDGGNRLCADFLLREVTVNRQTDCLAGTSGHNIYWSTDLAALGSRAVLIVYFETMRP